MAERFTRNISKDYDASDVEHVYRVCHPSNWEQMDKWLQKNGLTDNELTPGETAHLIADLKEVEKAKIPFSANPSEAANVLRQHRNEQTVQEWTKREIQQLEKMR